MSDWNQPDFYDDDDPNSNPDGKQTNPVRDRLRKLEKENKELKEQHAEAMKQLRQTNIANVLTDKVKDPAKVARLIPADVDSTAEAIEKWLADYADVFAVVPAEDPAPEGDGEPPEPDANADAMGRIGKATQSGATPTKQADMAAKLADPNLTRDELIKLIEAAGGGYGSG